MLNFTTGVNVLKATTWTRFNMHHCALTGLAERMTITAGPGESAAKERGPESEGGET